eukprot:CAMPEP_0173452062 /NCGR_PEP_ID=MMETSP1357-20121228/47979_1 /TAXON_ID=77926 /ORGANISM="Hemiselmis rufescens, Strain PCC563" /LENGTH=60 /DNA_ID=CAMNT_0014418887 /DNA_START=50 /DNA_END=228 /DNA_ORIENTATION=+
MYWPILFVLAPSLTLTASALVSGSRCPHEAARPVREHTSCLVPVSQTLTALAPPSSLAEA